ncbi:MAG TPA: HNH endonuclease, partial [Verrucomicrobiae bacterium]
GGAIADAAHIESWAESENDDIQEGLALHKNAHWRFGEWLWSVTSVEWGMQIEWKYGGRLLECADGVRLGPNAERSGRHRAFHGSR